MNNEIPKELPASVDPAPLPVVTASWWNQLHDPKEGRPIRDIPYTGTCKSCGKWDGHQLDCPEVSIEQLARMVKKAQHQEESAKKRSKRYWEQLQRAVGRVAMLRHENNKLRKANETLKARSQEH
jgi:hypothetical protein